MLAVAAVGLAGTSAALGAQLPPSVVLDVPTPPTVATADGASFMVYELHVTNLSAAPVTLRRVEVLSGGADRRVLLSLEDSTLARMLARPGVSPAPAVAERARIGGGLRAITFLWVPVDGRTPPTRLRHRLLVATSDTATAQAIEGATVPVTAAAVVIGPPLRGGGWLTANGPDPFTGHRRALVPVDGIPAIAQRFAIDYLQVDANGATFSGDRANNDSYFAEGEDAIAVADGVVAAIEDGIPENVPGINSRAVPITLETVGGNYVILDIGGGRYAFYAHLKPGSLRVKLGQRVRRGQVVGLVGNSGNSTEPHLHFHVSDGTAPLASQGLPYLHDAFQLEGRCRRLLVDCTRLPAPETRRREQPLANMILRFPDRD
jgi:murein DD-endopeptidase MepM/ murein hydrolase activator NlpD